VLLSPLAGLLPASIPSPSVNVVEIGPLSLHIYGLCIALGVIAAVTISSKRWEARGGDPDDIGTIASGPCPPASSASRIYHVATDWKTYQGDWVGALKITNGGLGIPGGIAVRRASSAHRGQVAKGLARAGRCSTWSPRPSPWPRPSAGSATGSTRRCSAGPTDLPWGLEIDPEHRPPGLDAVRDVPPDVPLRGALEPGARRVLVLARPSQGDATRGELFWCYVLGYAIGRLWVESLRSMRRR
jgi:hypothetical protein